MRYKQQRSEFHPAVILCARPCIPLQNKSNDVCKWSNSLIVKTAKEFCGKQHCYTLSCFLRQTGIASYGDAGLLIVRETLKQQRSVSKNDAIFAFFYTTIAPEIYPKRRIPGSTLTFLPINFKIMMA